MILALAFTLAFLTATVGTELWYAYSARAREQRQRKCREWIEWKLRGPSPTSHFEAQCAFRALMDPKWAARGPWEWEEEPAWVRAARERDQRFS